VAPPPGNPRFPLIDPIRGIAVLMVMSGHSFGRILASNPYRDQLGWGVGVFFAISGFLLYRPFVAASAGQAPTVRARDFYRRRIFRIVPGYWLAFTVLAPIYAGLKLLGPDAWRYYLLIQSYDKRTYGGGLGVSWSLSIEAGLYLVLPLFTIIVGLLHRRARRSWMSDMAAVAFVMAVCVVLLFYWPHFSSSLAFFGVLGNSIIFMLGMLAAVLSVGERESSRIQSLFAFAARHTGACWVGAVALLFLSAGEHNSRSGYLLEGLIAILVLMPAIVARGKSRIVHGILNNKALTWVGLISYGLYLWHDPLLFELRGAGRPLSLEASLAATVFTWCVTFAIASASYYVLEVPMMRYGKNWHPLRALRGSA
jgi:peptidoglycan/LPS O-acetylase OafA/YrhL